MKIFFPPASFCYAVAIDGSRDEKASFQEVSGIEVSTEVETISEAGLNTYSHRVPKRTSYGNLVLKRGLFVKDSKLLNWVKDSVQSGFGVKIKPKPIVITLFDPDGVSHVSWSFANAYPVKWSLGQLNAMESKIAVETIEFAYSYWKFA
jgi:phage tail-like protein